MPFSCRWLPLVLLAALCAAPARAQNGLKLELAGEEPSGVFWDSDTLQTQTSLLFSFKVSNQKPAPCRVKLRWQIADANGFVLARKNAEYDLAAQGLLNIRDLFAPPGRGAFLLSVQAQAKRSGADDSVQASWPFAVLAAPAAQFRPQSFFTLDAPLLLSEVDLDFYARSGARVLRSTFTAAPRSVVDEQLRARLRRSVATLAVLNGADIGTLPVLTRYSAVKTWELPLVRNADFTGAARGARPDAAFVMPMAAGASSNSLSVNLVPQGVVFPGDGAPQANIPGGVAHPAALRRALMAARVQAASRGAALQVRAALPASATPMAGAGALVTRYALAVMSGASNLSLAYDESKDAQTRMAQAAAFAQMTKLLEDAAFVDDLFPRSPVLFGALFQTPKGSAALLWSARDGSIGHLKARLPGAQILDLFGNEQGGSVVPLGPSPVYVVSPQTPGALGAALRAGQVEGIPAVVARALPITQKVTGAANKIVVRLQNVLAQPASGTLRVGAPGGWTLAQNEQNFQLAPGEIRDYVFAADSTQTASDGFYPVSLAIGRESWKQSLRVACADNVRSGQKIRLDGKLNEWQGASWMEIRPARQSAAGARVALRWDAAYLYVAAQVSEPALRPAPGSEAFWEGDALEIALGTKSSRPDAAPFRDSDYLFALLPQGGGQIVASNFALPRGARCALARDERAKVTLYEACLPLAALPELKPAARAVSEAPVRCGWILHNNEGAPLEWSAAVSVFQWWRNPSTFAAPARLFLAAQMPLGFVQEGSVNQRAPEAVDAPPLGLTTGLIAPNPPTQNTPPKAPPRKSPPTGGLPEGGLLAPMSPRLLPPVGDPEGKIILPQPPAAIKS